MTSITPAFLPQSVDYAYRYQQGSSHALDARLKNTDGEQSVKISASSSTVVTFSGVQQSSVYQAANVNVPTSGSSADAASNILDFISLRLQRDFADGSGRSELGERLQAAYAGFIEGYTQAYDTLNAANLLDPEIEAVISQTHDEVLEGISKLAQEYGLESPVDNRAVAPVASAKTEEQQYSAGSDTAAVIAADRVASVQSTFRDFAAELVGPATDISTLLKSSLVGYERLAKREFSFELKTQDGDTILIRASASQNTSAKVSHTQYGSGSSASRSDIERSASNRFNLSVEGELDADELVAINDLLNQVADLSDQFFQGDIEGAFNMALDIGFDQSEIARFALHLRQSVTTTAEATYSRLLPDNTISPAQIKFKEQLGFANGDNSLARLLDFIQILEDTREKAKQLDLDFAYIVELAESASRAQYSETQHAQSLSLFIQRYASSASTVLAP